MQGFERRSPRFLFNTLATTTQWYHCAWDANQSPPTNKLLLSLICLWLPSYPEHKLLNKQSNITLLAFPSHSFICLQQKLIVSNWTCSDENELELMLFRFTSTTLMHSKMGPFSWGGGVAGFFKIPTEREVCAMGRGEIPHHFKPLWPTPTCLLMQKSYVWYVPSNCFQFMETLWFKDLQNMLSLSTLFKAYKWKVCL